MTDMRHIYLTVSGDVTDEPTEHWQFGIRFLLLSSGVTPDEAGTLGTSTVDAVNVARTEADWTIVNSWNTTPSSVVFNPDDWLNDQVAPALQSFFGPGISSQMKVKTVKASPITATGHVAEGRTCVLSFTSAYPQGASTGNCLPLEVATVVSWATPVIGRKGRGRIYLPALTTAAVDSAGRLTHTVRGSIADAMQSMLEGMAYVGGIGSNIWVLPIVCSAAATSYGQITSLSIGDVFDAQRRRRRSLVEDRESRALSY